MIERMTRDEVRVAFEDQLRDFLNRARFRDLTPDRWDAAFTAFRRREPLCDFVERDAEWRARVTKAIAENG